MIHLIFISVSIKYLMITMNLKLSRVSKYALTNPSSIREIMNIITDYKLHPEKYPKKLIYLAGGWPQDPPPEFLRDALLELASDKKLFVKSSRYGATRGQPNLISKIVEYEKKIYGKKVQPEELLVGLGSTDLTSAFFKAVLNPGDNVIIATPGYLNYKRQIEIELELECCIKKWQIIDENGNFDPDVDKLESTIDDKTKAIILSSPGNPDGQVLNNRQYEKILKVAEEHQIFLVIDLAYRAFIYEEAPQYVKKRKNPYEVHLCSFSKEFRVPGWRIGYIVANKNLIEAIETIEQARTLTPSRIVQEAITLMFQKQGIYNRLKQFHERSLEKYREIGLKTYEMLKSIEGLQPLRPFGGFYVFFKHKKWKSREFCNELLLKEQVALVPGIDFGLEGWTRLSFAPVIEDLESLEEGIRRISNFIKSNKHL